MNKLLAVILIATGTACGQTKKDEPPTVPPTVTEVPMTRTVETCPKGYTLERWYEPTPIYGGLDLRAWIDRAAGYYPVDPPAPPVADPHPDRCVKEVKP